MTQSIEINIEDIHVRRLDEFGNLLGDWAPFQENGYVEPCSRVQFHWWVTVNGKRATEQTFTYAPYD